MKGIIWSAALFKVGGSYPSDIHMNVRSQHIAQTITPLTCHLPIVYPGAIFSAKTDQISFLHCSIIHF